MSHSLDYRQWVNAYCTGKARRYVAYGLEPAQKVAKTLATMVRKQNITLSEIREILNDVQRNSVLACSDQQLMPNRSKRFSELQGLFDEALQ